MVKFTILVSANLGNICIYSGGNGSFLLFLHAPSYIEFPIDCMCYPLCKIFGLPCCVILNINNKHSYETNRTLLYFPAILESKIIIQYFVYCVILNLFNGFLNFIMLWIFFFFLQFM